jgi:hypothetical protein
LAAAVITSLRDVALAMHSNARIDALELMLTDLRTRNEPIRHKAAFRGCQPEFQALVSQLIEQLETELLDQKRRHRNDKGA